MIGTVRTRQKCLRTLLLISGALARACCCRRSSALAFAGIQIGSTSSESVSFALYNTTTAGGSPVWSGPNNSGMLISAGSPYLPALTTINGTPQNYSVSNVGTINDVRSASVPPLPASFGAATVAAAASAILPNGGTVVNSRIGVSFNSGTFLQSAATMTPGTAAVSYTTLHADFVNTGPGPYVGSAGAVISATGNLSHTPGSFVELANTGKITINGVTSPFYVIEGFAYNSLLQENAINLLSPGGSASISAPDPTTGNFSIYAVFNLVPSVSIPKGATFSVDSQLTLVSDPGSLIQLSGFASLPPGTEIPTIGAFAGGPIPEPSSWIQFGSAMALLLAFWGRARLAAVRRPLAQDAQCSACLPRQPDVPDHGPGDRGGRGWLGHHGQ